MKWALVHYYHHRLRSIIQLVCFSYNNKLQNNNIKENTHTQINKKEVSYLFVQLGATVDGTIIKLSKTSGSNYYAENFMVNGL